MRIAFVNPGPSEYQRADAARRQAETHPPLNLIALASYCRAQGLECHAFDLAVAPRPEEALGGLLDDYQPEVVAFSVLTPTSGMALEHAARCRERGLRVVLGGAATLFDRVRLAGSGRVDALICGEGERPLVQVVNAWAQGRSLDGIPGVYWEGCQHYAPAQRLHSLDELPPIDFGTIDWTPYVKNESLGLVTSRGCPYDCHFCSCQKMWSRRVSYLSVERVVAQLDELVRRHDYAGKMVTLFDDTFTANRGRVEALCRELSQRPEGARWKAMTRVDTVDPVLLRSMYAAGCRRVCFGIEGTCDEDLERLNKHIDLGRVHEALRAAHDAGLVTEGYFMMGFPWQQRAELQAAVERMSEFELDVRRLSYLTPYPGTHFADNLERFGLRTPSLDQERFTSLLPVVETDHFTLEDQARAMAEFIARHEIDEAGAGVVADHPFRPPPPGTGRRMRSSPYLVRRSVKGGVLVYEYWFGQYAVLNNTADRVLRVFERANDVPSAAQAIQREFPACPEEDVADLVADLLELRFLREC